MLVVINFNVFGFVELKLVGMIGLFVKLFFIILVKWVEGEKSEIINEWFILLIKKSWLWIFFSVLKKFWL